MSGAPRIEWAARARPAEGEVVCGDRHLVRSRGGAIFAAAIDGLGHGMPAADAAQAAADLLDVSAEFELPRLLAELHGALLRTRGVAVSIARLEQDRLTWAGVGNVEAAVVGVDGTSTRLRTENGIVGQSLGVVRPQVVPLSPGDTLILATDGVEPDFPRLVVASEPAAAIAAAVLAELRRAHDDALVLVVRCLGGAR